MRSGGNRPYQGIGIVDLDSAQPNRQNSSEADRRRTYLALAPGAFDALRPAAMHDAARVVFVCTHNSARSQLAAALWNDTSVVHTRSGPEPAALPDPARTGGDAAFDRVVTDLTDRIARVAPAVRPTDRRADTGGPHAG